MCRYKHKKENIKLEYLFLHFHSPLMQSSNLIRPTKQVMNQNHLNQPYFTITVSTHLFLADEFLKNLYFLMFFFLFCSFMSCKSPKDKPQFFHLLNSLNFQGYLHSCLCIINLDYVR